MPPGTPMAGYAAREGGSTGVHDPLTVRALVMDVFALVVADVCAVHERTAAEIRRLTTDLVEDVVVLATHTHSGPCLTFGRLGPHAAAVHEDLVREAVAAVAEACQARVECSLEYGAARGSGVAKNRRHPDRPIDPPIEALRFRRGDLPVATLVTYPCHPVVLDAANRLVSGDYPSYVRDAIEANGGVAVWATGCAGDVNTGHSAEASFRADATGRRTFEEAQRVGTLVGDTLIQGEFTTVSSRLAAFVRTEIVLPLSRVDPEQTVRDRGSWEQAAASSPPPLAALYGAWVAWADQMSGQDAGGGQGDDLPRADPQGNTEEDGWHGFVSVLDLGGAAIVMLPGEPFLAVADAIKTSAPKPVLVLGYADGVPGYLPTADEYPYGGYEVVDAHRYYGMRAGFAAGAAEQMVDVAVGLLSRDG